MEESRNQETTIIRTDGGVVRVVREWEDYDPALCCNGGSYYQPYFTCTCPRRGEALTIEDTSCGDFGSRVNVCLRRRGRVEAWTTFGSMYTHDCLEYTTFTRCNPSHRFWLSLTERLGYRLPTVEDEEEDE